MHLRINRLCPVLGADATGLDASCAIADSEFEQIRKALWDSDGVLVLRDQNLTPDQQIAFSRRFGELFGEADPLQDSVAKYLLPGYPQIFRVSNKVVKGEPQGRSRAGNYWHSDVSFRKRPAMVSLLHAIEIPPIGGDTLFCSMYSAYEGLSEVMQQFLEPLDARHDFAVNTGVGFANETIEQQDLDEHNAAVHPVVRVHPESGRKCLFVNPGNTSHLIGLHASESRLLPLATMSGLMRPSSVGPAELKELKFARPVLRTPPLTASRTEPTAMRFFAVAFWPTVL